MEEKRLSVEDLMKPRFKMIADWPGNTKYEVGEILNGYYPGYGGGELIRNDKGESVWLSPEKYPAIFKKLEWWQERKESDMPEYVKSLINQKYYKVTSSYTFSFKGICNVAGELGIDYPWDNVLPATEQDYLNQNKA